MRTRIVALAAGGVVTLCAGCGSDTTAPATGSTPSPAPGAGRTLVRGEVVAITGGVVTLTDAGHIDVDFELTPTTQVGQQQDADITAVTLGTCAFGSGQRLAGDVVAAAEVSIEDHRAGGCRRGGATAAGRALQGQPADEGGPAGERPRLRADAGAVRHRHRPAHRRGDARRQQGRHQSGQRRRLLPLRRRILGRARQRLTAAHPAAGGGR
jgi:hypothetical protein